jgi:8-oxo-dGTP diphosphatase
MTEVTAALIWDRDKMMICQRPAHKARGLLWEFPGGKQEPGETLEACLIRECREELAVTVRVTDIFMDVVHEYPDLTVHLTLFNAEITEGIPRLNEHHDIRWITVDEIPDYDFCPADTEILERLRRKTGGVAMLAINEKMARTLKLAEEAMQNGECPIAAIVYLDDEIVAQGYTKEFSEKRLLVHAELNALIEADLKRYSYLDRTRMQLFTNLEPCLMCMGAAMSSFIGEVWYALESPSDGAAALIRQWTPQDDGFASYKAPAITGGILREESKALFKRFAESCPPGGLKDFAESLAKL